MGLSSSAFTRTVLMFGGFLIVAAVALLVLPRLMPNADGPQEGAETRSPVPTSIAAIASTPPSSPSGVAFEPPPTEAFTPATPRPSPSSPPSASTPLVNVLAHDRFWDPFVDFGSPIGMPYGLMTVRDATELADLVIVGSISDLYIGEQWAGSPDAPPEPFAYVLVEIHEVLKGQPVSRSEGTVEVQFGFGYSDRNFDIISSEPMPTGQYVWFLIHEAGFREAGGRPPRDSEIAPFAYFIPNEVQGVVLDADGAAEVVLADRFEGSWGTERFPMSIRGQSFESVVAEVRTIVAIAP